MDCGNFKNSEIMTDAHCDRTECKDCCPKMRPKKTNGDRIREMTDHKLAMMFGRKSLCVSIPIGFCDARSTCVNCIEEWLQQPAEGE